MKLLLASSALAAILAAAPAYAQVTSAPPADQGAQQPATRAETQRPPPDAQAESSAEGDVKVQGVPPSQVLGAIETEKLTDEGQQSQAANEAKTEQQATAETETDEQTADAGARDEPAQQASSSTISTANVELSTDHPIPEEVQQVVAEGDYTTEDIVLAQLEAVRSAPPVTQATTTNDAANPPSSPAPGAPAADAPSSAPLPPPSTPDEAAEPN